MFIRKDRIARAKIKINISSYIMCLNVYMCVHLYEFMCMPWNWSFEWLLAPMWIQWNECRSLQEQQVFLLCMPSFWSLLSNMLKKH